jgi:hypothetical protein
MAMPRKNVPPPLFTPPSYTLLDYVQWVDDADPHWQGGITWQDLCGDVGIVQDVCVTVTGAPVTGSVTKVETADMSLRGAEPFTIYAEIDCSPVGFWTDARANVNAALTRFESYAVEKAFIDGVIPGQTGLVRPHVAEDTAEFVDSINPGQVLIQPAVSVPVTGTLDVTEGLGVLERSLGDCYHGVGLVLVTLPVFNNMVANYLVFKVNGRWQTAKGNWVVPMYGHPGTAPSGTVPAYGTSWMYIVGAVFGYRSGVKLNGVPEEEFFDRSVNTLEIIAERTYVLGWSCCQAGVPVSFGGTITGSPNSAT